ncbi:MAG: hypothetical protein ACK55Z_19950, partial [bacterium]
FSDSSQPWASSMCDGRRQPPTREYNHIGCVAAQLLLQTHAPLGSCGSATRVVRNRAASPGGCARFRRS